MLGWPLRRRRGLVQGLEDEISAASRGRLITGRAALKWRKKSRWSYSTAHTIQRLHEALAGELQRLSGERPVANTDDAWVLVVGAGTGHDAAGILYALAPVVTAGLADFVGPSTGAQHQQY